MSIVKLDNIQRQYKSGQLEVNALQGINLIIKEKDFVSIMGPSGSGKSTLLNILGCLDYPTSGSYELAGQQIEKLNDSRLAEIRNEFIGFVFQSFHLLADLDARSNVELPLIYRGITSKHRRQRAEKALEAVGLTERSKHMPSQLSGGEQQRVAIARALVGEPAVILADEPTGALDSKTSKTIMRIFQKLNREQGLTIIQVTHEYGIACHSNRVVHLLDGSIEKEELLDKPLDA